MGRTLMKGSPWQEAGTTSSQASPRRVCLLPLLVLGGKTGASGLVAAPQFRFWHLADQD
jgi:hypothetical protein